MSQGRSIESQKAGESSPEGQSAIALAQQGSALTQEEAAAILEASKVLQEEKHERKAELLEQLAALFSENQLSSVNAKIEALRKTLREIMENETRETQAFCDQIFKIQLLLAEHWPVNARDDMNKPLDPISLEPISSEDRILLSSGHQFDRRQLSGYYAKGDNSIQSDWRDTDRYRHPVRDDYFSARELTHLKASGVSFEREAAAAYNSSGYRSEIENQAVFLGHAVDVMMNWINRPSDTLLDFVRKGAAFGSLMGGFIALLLTAYLLCYFCFFYLTPFSLLLCFGIGLGYSLFELKRGGNASFSKNVQLAFYATAIVALLSYLGPLLIVGLGAASLISSASVTAATLIWMSIIQPLAPLTLGLVAAVKEYFTPGTMKNIFERIFWRSLAIPAVLVGIVSGLPGGLVGALGYAMKRLINFGSAEQAAPPGAGVRLIAEAENQSISEPQLRNNAQILQRLSLENEEGNVLSPSASLDSVSPRTRAAIRAVLEDERSMPSSPSSIRANESSPRTVGFFILASEEKETRPSERSEERRQRQDGSSHPQV